MNLDRGTHLEATKFAFQLWRARTDLTSWSFRATLIHSNTGCTWSVVPTNVGRRDIVASVRSLLVVEAFAMGLVWRFDMSDARRSDDVGL